FPCQGLELSGCFGSKSRGALWREPPCVKSRQRSPQFGKGFLRVSVVNEFPIAVKVSKIITQIPPLDPFRDFFHRRVVTDEIAGQPAGILAPELVVSGEQVLGQGGQGLTV